jgi:hypothetical protein
MQERLFVNKCLFGSAAILGKGHGGQVSAEAPTPDADPLSVHE